MKKQFLFLLYLCLSAHTIACNLPEGFKAVAPPSPVALDDYHPKANGWTLLNLWALWCAPCRAELPLLDTYQANEPSLKIDTLNLNDGEEAAKQLFADLKISHLSAQSTQDTNALSKLNAIGLPYTALLHDGKLIATKSGILKETQTITDFIHCKQKETL